MDESQQQFQAELDQIQTRLHRGRLGLVAGAVLGVAIAVASAIVLGTEGATVGDLATVVTLGCFGAAIGQLITVGRLEGRSNDVVGLGVDADRIKRTVRGEDHGDLSPEQQQRAARYAALTVLVSPAQALRWGLLVSGILVGQIARLIESTIDAGPPFTGLIAAALGIVGALVLAALIPARRRAARNARTYSQTHPWQNPTLSTADEIEAP